MNRNTHYITMEAVLGSEIKDSLSSAVSLSIGHALPVRFLFNGVRVEVSAADLLGRYADMYQLAAQSPDGRFFGVPGILTNKEEKTDA